MAFPKLLELFAPYFLIDLLENVRHFNGLQPAMKVVYAGPTATSRIAAVN